MVNPIENPDLYDYAVIAGKKTPGLIDISGATSPREWDIRKGYGLSGATVVYTGDGLAKFTMRLFFWLAEHFNSSEWTELRKLLKKPPRGTQGRALDISHPHLEELDIASFVVEDVTQWDQPEPGLFAKDVKCIQYRAPLPMLSRPDGSQATADEPTAQTEAEKQIESLIGQAKGLL